MLSAGADFELKVREAFKANDDVSKESMLLLFGRKCFEGACVVHLVFVSQESTKDTVEMTDKGAIELSTWKQDHADEFLFRVDTFSP